MTKTNKKGFTLVELLAVIVILAVLILVALPNVMSLTEKAKRKAFLNDAFAFIDAAEKKYVQEGYEGCEVFTYYTYNDNNKVEHIIGKNFDVNNNTRIDTMKFKADYKAYVMVNPGQESVV